ncbi:AAA family ATPase [Paenibacillus antarcticus]|uniref:Nuclease SbcCD subunit C n=1 Tax=Paenibacillus antarcticus TaxID=253703 RepID=A0A168KB35_9BACL|nr:AAA family ATPase [Paenibacillus antarcticus]OAB41792.1 chromosome segregation protein SMC [Paenibacillus antarcticus]
MSKNLKLKNDFQNFTLSNDSKLYTPDEIKLINLIIKNFDSIAEVGTAGGNRRAKLFKDLLTNYWGNISPELVITGNNWEGATFPIKQLKKIEIENFRGFSNQFFHDFTKQYTLIYGTNGSGKTSFCEALEYSLLGYISEAESKRYDSNKYIVNVATGKGQKPKLTVIDKNDAEIEVSASPNSYHFCFIEKNRIDGFARISANTPSNQTQMLSTLLGLEDLNQYVSGFTENIENYINTNVLEGVKYKELAQKTKEIDADRASIDTNNNNVIKLQSERDLFIKESKLEMTFEEIDVYLHGTSEKNGRLFEIDEEIQNISHVHYESNGLKYITENYEEILLALKEYNQLKEVLDKSKDQISFKQLFSALKELKSISEDKCPACLTPIDLVVKNPFNHAAEKLSELGKLAQLEERIELISEEIVSKTTRLISDIGVKIKFAKELSASVQFDFTQHLLYQELKQSNIKNKVIDIEALINEVKRNNESLEVLEQLLNFKNLEYKNSSEKKNTLHEEKKHLKGLSDKIKNIQTQESTYKKLISDAQVKLQEFDKSNETLLREVEIEKQQVAINKEFVDAYKSLLAKLKRYNLELPGKLISNMNELTRDFYNEINKHDSDFELLEKIELPTKPEDRITAYFKDNPTKAVDALHVLSEGHVRCLGLSLLLSKIVRDNINIIIFDDVVNAIDDDHRGGIREVLVNSQLLNNKQIILTSHAEEFIKDLENQVGKRQYDKLITRITFLPPEKRILRTDNISTSHYLTNAKHFLDRSQRRDCLRYCRGALENINSLLWSRLGRTYNAQITVQIRKPKGLPDTMSTSQGLSKFIKNLKKKEGSVKFDRIIEIYDYLTGLETTNQTAWNYLNKGTHEEEEMYEFDSLIVKKIYENLENLDNEAKAV